MYSDTDDYQFKLDFWGGLLSLAFGVLNLCVHFSLIPFPKGQFGSWIWLFTGLMGVGGGIGFLLKSRATAKAKFSKERTRQTLIGEDSMHDDKDSPLISFGTFLFGVALVASGLLATEHFGNLWPFGVTVLLATIVTVLGLISPGGSVLWIFKVAFQEYSKKHGRN